MLRRAAGFVILFALAATASAAGPQDLATIRRQYVDSVLPITAAAQADLLKAAQNDAAKIKDDGSWADIDYTDQARSAWKLQQHLDRLLVMAEGCELARRQGKPDDAMKAKALAAIDWWLAHDPHNPNWWWNEIGIPQLLGETTMLIQSEMSSAQTLKVIQIMKRSVWTKWTGQNLVWGCMNQVVRGCIENDPATVAAAYARMYEEVRIEPRNLEGIQQDFSFHQHGRQLYNGGYGLNFAEDVGRFMSFAWGTSCQIPPENMDAFTHYMLDGEQWMMLNARLDYSTLGREITRKGKTAVPKSWTTGPISPAGAAYSLLNSVRMVAALPVPRQSEWKAFEQRLADDPSAPPLVGNRMFFCSDYMTHHRDTGHDQGAWMATLKMFSSRMLNAELVNNEGKKSHHLADGATLIYRNGDEYYDIFPVWDWCHIPGTTAEQVDDLNAWDPKGNHIKGQTDFVGGVSDGTDGAAVMDLQRQTLKAHKAWFFLDDGFLCMGNGVTWASDHHVDTCVNQCLLNGKVEEADDLSWVYHDGVGYIFPQKENVMLFTGPHSGRWSDLGTGSDQLVTRDVFMLSIHHTPGSDYVYYVAPGASAEQTRAKAANPGIDILANTADVQAIRDRKLNLTAVAFWKAGKIATVESDQPCVVMIRGGKIAVSDPTQKLSGVNLRVDNVPYKIDFPSGDLAGSSVGVTLKPAGLEGL